MIPKRVKNYVMIILLYCCSLYHFVFSFMVNFINEGIQNSLANAWIIESLGMQVGKLRASLLPVYGFETFTLMTCFIVFDYWLIRSPSYPKMSMRQFLDAFLFSQLAYIGYIYQFKNEVIGINAFESGVWFFMIYLPMFVITCPL